MAKDLRIPFEVAIAEPGLLKGRFAQLSLPQQVALKAMYGCRLSDSIRDDRGWSELDYFWAFQEKGTYDELGFLRSVDRGHRVYRPEEYREVWANEGVRSGKSDALAGTIVVYEAVCGGHEAYTRPGKRVYCFQVAQDLGQAQYSLFGIRATLEGIPLLQKGNRIRAVTARRIDLWNGVTIATVPPTVKAVRGYDSPVAVMDEIGVWYQDADSANPDIEVYNQLQSRQAQFEHPKIVGISSPWRKAGLLYERFLAGTNGVKRGCEQHEGEADYDCPACREATKPHRSRLCLHITTAASANPLVKREWLAVTHDRNPKAFARECLAEFQDSVSGFLDPSLLRKAVSIGTRERPPLPAVSYIAAMDPAFRRDAFGFIVAHVDKSRKVVFDYVKRWMNAPGEDPIDARGVIHEIAAVCGKYRVHTIVSDQHHNESLRLLFEDLGLTLIEHSIQAGSKQELWANFQSLLRQNRLDFVDHEQLLRELLALERTLGDGGTAKIAAPRGEHDDLAMTAALVAQHAMWNGGMGVDDAPPEAEREPTPHEIIQKQISSRQMVVSAWD